MKRFLVAIPVALLFIVVGCAPSLQGGGPPAARPPVAQTAPNATSGAQPPAPAPQLGTPTETLVLETPLPTSTPAPPTPVIPEGLYVTYMYTRPDPPQRGENTTFTVAFVNDANADYGFRWIVHIFKMDNLKNSYGETTVTRTVIPPGAHEEQSLGYWKLPLGGPCETFVARVDMIDDNNQSSQFKQPGGQLFEQPVEVCPP